MFQNVFIGVFWNIVLKQANPVFYTQGSEGKLKILAKS